MDAQKKCSAIATIAGKTKKAGCDEEKASGCTWVAAATGPTEDNGTCKAECKCSGTTVVSATVAFVAAILLL
jgi:hypothetical protein